MFEKNNEIFSFRKCYRCHDLITSRSEEIQHNFIKHYQKGEEIPVENRQFKKQVMDQSLDLQSTMTLVKTAMIMQIQRSY